MSDPAAVTFEAPPVEVLAPLFPHFEILNLVACGGMGAVYRARQASLDRIVAIKILPPELGADVEYAKRFQAEARLMANLSNAHIVTVFDFGMAGSYLYFVMEYVDGKTLHQMLEEGGPLKYDACLRVMAEVCRGLDYAHEKGLVHLDIKPGNIMINREGEARVLDFGLAKLLDPRKGSATEKMGTPDYAAPERLVDGAKVDHRADIYSLGIMFYELLTGKIPRGNYTPASKVAGVDPGVDEVISRSTKPNPEERYGKAREIFGELVKLRRNALHWKAVGGSGLAGQGGAKLGAGTGAGAHQQPRGAGMAQGKPGKKWVGWAVGGAVCAILVVGLLLSGGDKAGAGRGGKREGKDGGKVEISGEEGEWKPPRDRPKRPLPEGEGEEVASTGGGEEVDPDEPDAGEGEPEKPEVEKLPFPPEGLVEEMTEMREALEKGEALDAKEWKHLKVYKGRAYYMIPRRLTWREAEAFAGENGAHLATVTSGEEEKFIRDMWFGSASDGRGSRPVWIGGQRGEDGWEWVSGEEWDYEDWRDGADVVGGEGVPMAVVLHEVSWLSRPEESAYSALIEWDPPKKEVVGGGTEPEMEGTVVPKKPDVPERPLTALEKLRKGFEERVASDVVGQREASRKELGEKYLGALEGLRERVAAMPVQEALVVAEISRYLAEKTPPERQDSWAELGRLQGVLIGESRRIDEVAKEKRLQLIRTYGDALLAMQADFTTKAQWDEVESAKEERKRIEALRSEEGIATVVAAAKGLEEVELVAEGEKAMRFVVPTPDGEGYLVSGGMGGEFLVVSADGGEVKARWEAGHGVGPCAFLPGGDRFVAVGADGEVEVWSLSGQVAQFSGKETTGSPTWLALRPDGMECLVGLTTFKEPKEPGQAGQAGVRQWVLTDPPVKGEFDSRLANALGVYAPDGRYVAWSERKGLILAVPGKAEGVWTNKDCKGEAVAFSEDGKTVVCGRIVVNVEDGETRADLRLAEPERFLDEAEARRATVVAVEMDVDGIHAFFGLLGGGLEVWNLETSKRVIEVEDAHGAALTGVELGAGGERLATSDAAGEVKLWKVLR